MPSLTAASRDVRRDTKAATAPRKNEGATGFEKICVSLSMLGINSMLNCSDAWDVASTLKTSTLKRDGCALPQRLSRFPAAWSALSRRSLGDRKTPSPGSNPHPSVPVDRLQKLENGGRYLVVLDVTSAQFVSDIPGYITRPAFGRVERDDPNR